MHKCWLLCKIPHLFSWENITRNIFCLCAKTKDSIDSDTISNIRIIYRMCREGDKLADSCLKQTTLFDDIVSRWTPFIVFFVFEDSIIIWFSLFTEIARLCCIFFCVRGFVFSVRRAPRDDVIKVSSSIYYKQSRRQERNKKESPKPILATNWQQINACAPPQQKYTINSSNYSFRQDTRIRKFSFNLQKQCLFYNKKQNISANPWVLSISQEIPVIVSQSWLLPFFTSLVLHKLTFEISHKCMCTYDPTELLLQSSHSTWWCSKKTQLKQ